LSVVRGFDCPSSTVYRAVPACLGFARRVLLGTGGRVAAEEDAAIGDTCEPPVRFIGRWLLTTRPANVSLERNLWTTTP
jgi:hypothetical protein